ncbi:MAG: HdeD family acid-resistance protein [Terrimicrobiaceae bacterium]
MSSKLSPSELAQGRTWYFLGGGLCVLVGLFSIVRPGIASFAIEQFLGLVFIASGIVLLLSAIFGKAEKHRVLELASSALRLIVGFLLIAKALNGVIALTLVVASIFLVEGIFGVIFALKFRGKNPAWIWILLNALAAFVLSGMLFANFPSDAVWAIGLLFGINSLILGVSLIMFALAMPGSEEI